MCLNLYWLRLRVAARARSARHFRNWAPGLFSPGLILPVSKARPGVSHWLGIRICACLLGCFFVKFGIAIGGFHQRRLKEPKLHKLGVFWVNYCKKKHPIWAKLGAFLSKMVYWWGTNWVKNWYRESQIFEVRQALHPRTIWWNNPPGSKTKPLYRSVCIKDLDPDLS